MSTQRTIKLKLAVFMFLQYFIWGSWYVSMGAYLANVLKFGGAQIGAAYGAFAIGAMVSPFFVGLIADRYFASQRLLGALGILGALVLFTLPRLQTFGAFYPMLILYCALFVPTLALGNSLSFHHLGDPKRDFPRLKILSAVGWIAAGITLSSLRGEHSVTQFYLAGTASLIFGIYSLWLPHTPPRKVGRHVGLGEALGLDALALLKRPSFAVYVGCMFLICIPLKFYFVMMAIYLSELQWDNIAGNMSLAQVSDVVFLFLLPIMLKRWGFKRTICLGIFAWVARYGFLAQSVESPGLQALLIYGAILLHGVCYDFLFIAGQLYADSQANERIRGAVQGFMAFILWGAGAFAGTLLAGRFLAANELAAPLGTISHDWQSLWIVPALGAAIMLVVFAVVFREPLVASPENPAARPASSGASAMSRE